MWSILRHFAAWYRKTSCTVAMFQFTPLLLKGTMKNWNFVRTDFFADTYGRSSRLPTVSLNKNNICILSSKKGVSVRGPINTFLLCMQNRIWVGTFYLFLLAVCILLPFLQLQTTVIAFSILGLIPCWAAEVKRHSYERLQHKKY